MIVAILRATTLLTSVTSSLVAGIRPCLIELFIWALGINGTAEGVDIYRAFKQRPNGILVFNHPTAYDHAVMYKEIDASFCYVVKTQRLGLLGSGMRKYGEMIEIDEGQSTAAIIKNKVQVRKPGDRLIAIAPAAGHAAPHLVPLGPFHKGAFLPRTPVLPVVIHYSPFVHRSKDLHVIIHFWQTLCAAPIRYRLRVLPPMAQADGQTIDDFIDSVKKAMETALEELDSRALAAPYPLPPSPLAWSSLLFAFAAARAAYYGVVYPAIGMAITATTTAWCHGTQGINACFVDLFANCTMGLLFTVYALLQQNWVPVVCSCVALASFRYRLNHFWCVHVPAFVGFMTYG